MNTAAERAKELAGILTKRSPIYDGPDAIILGGDKALEIATLLESHARMLGAGLAENIQKIAARHATSALRCQAWHDGDGRAFDAAVNADSDRSTLLDAVRVLTVKVSDLNASRVEARNLWHADSNRLDQIAEMIGYQGTDEGLIPAVRAAIELAKAHPRCFGCSKDFATADEVIEHVKGCDKHIVGKIAAMVRIWANGDEPEGQLSARMVLGNIAELLGFQGDKP